MVYGRREPQMSRRRSIEHVQVMPPKPQCSSSQFTSLVLSVMEVHRTTYDVFFRSRLRTRNARLRRSSDNIFQLGVSKGCVSARDVLACQTHDGNTSGNRIS